MIVVCASLCFAGDSSFDKPGEVMPDRHWDFEHLDLWVKLDLDKRTVEGVVTHQVVPLGRPERWVRLHQVGLTIDRVEVDGEPVDGWRLGEDSLEVPVRPGQAAKVSVAYHAAPETGMYFRGGKGNEDAYREAFTKGEKSDNRHWFPGWDYPNDTFTVDTTVVVRDRFMAFAVGLEVDRREAERGWTAWNYRMDEPIPNYLVAVAAGEYRVVTDSTDSVPLEYIVSSKVSDEAVRSAFSATPDMMGYFETLFGTPYPYAVYRQVAVQRFPVGGMENPTLTIVHAALLQRDAQIDDWTLDVLAHELAHQWFGDLVGGYGWDELWIKEGMATFYADRWVGERRGEEWYAAQRRDHLKAARVVPVAAEDEYQHLYDWGSSVLHQLRFTLGGEVFDAGIRRYLQENRHRLATTDDLRRALEDASGTHLGWFFEQWVDGTGEAPYWLMSSWRYDGQLAVSVLQTLPEDPLVSAPFEVEVGTRVGTETHAGWIRDGRANLVIPLSEPPLWVAVDPDHALVARWTHIQDESAWIAQLERSPTAMARLAALEQPYTDERAVAPLAAWVADERHPQESRAQAKWALARFPVREAP